MSYAMSQALQAAVFQQLYTDPDLSSLVGTAIFDAMPPGGLPEIYVALGQENVRDRSDKSGAGAVHEFVISVVTEAAGFADAKTAAAAICDALVDADLSLTRGYLVYLNFHKARAARIGTGDTRRIDLTFRAHVSDADT